MSRKLTEEERSDLATLQKALGVALPAEHGAKASSIASSLIRIPSEFVTQSDLNRIFKDMGEVRNVVEPVVKKVALKPVKNQANTYTLVVPGKEDKPQVEAQEGQDQPAKGRRRGKAKKPADEGGQAEDKNQPDAKKQAEKANGKQSAEKKPAEKKRLPSPKKPKAKELPASNQKEAKGLPAATEEDGPKETNGAPTQTAKVQAKEAGRDKQTANGQTDGSNEAEATAADPTGSDVVGQRGDDVTSPNTCATPNEKAPGSEPASPEEDAEANAAQAEAPVQTGEEQADEPQASATNQSDAEEMSDANAEDEPKPEPEHEPEPPKRRSPTSLRYIRRDGPSSHEVRASILQLDQRFWINGWLLSHPDAYTLYEPEILALNDLVTAGVAIGDITRRQLAYQIDGDEKFFEMGAAGQKLLHAMGIEDLVRHRSMPKYDLAYFAPRRRKNMRVVITENLDPWYDIRDIMYEEGRATILGERVNAVILGEGTSILDVNHPNLRHNRLARLLESLGAESIELLYWGDIDRAGVEIMNRLREVIGERYPLKPFTAAYQLMIERARERYPEPRDNERTGQGHVETPDTTLLCEGLSEEDAAYATSVVNHSRLIPQEILTRADL